LNKGPKGWNPDSRNDNEKIVSLLEKYPPGNYNWPSLLNALPAAASINNLNKKALRTAIALQNTPGGVLGRP
jgi:hypothetical protein